MRDLGVVARVGGDEFGVVLPDTDASRAFALAEAARAAIEQAAPVSGTLRCSAGVASYPEDAKSAGALLQLAAGALAWAKESGRGRARRYDPEHVFVVTDEQREDFAALIARPAGRAPRRSSRSWRMASGEPVGYEALARFDGKPGLPPSWWFSQAHRFGLGAALEAESARAALAAPSRPAGTFLSINLSPSALASAEVAQQLPADLRGLVIEITEEERVLDVEGLQRDLEPLRARGARIAVDDAGEGYAGLQQVMSMRADIIKLDRALVADVNADPAKVALIGSLVHFARSTGAAICAEGIETLEELRVLIHLGVAYGQGWAVGRPGARWPRVNAEAARLCRELRSAQPRIVPVGRRRPDAEGGLMAPSTLTVLARLGTMFERTASVRDDADLQEVLEDVARAISEVLGYRAVVINVYRYAYDDMLTAAAVGSAESLQQLRRHDLAEAHLDAAADRALPPARGRLLRPGRRVRLGRARAWTPTCRSSSRATTPTPGCPATLCSCRCATGTTSCSA